MAWYHIQIQCQQRQKHTYIKQHNQAQGPWATCTWPSHMARILFVFASTDRFLCKYGFVYQAAQSISRSMGHMQLTKSYGTGEHSSYQLLPVSSGTVLAPVWLVPDQSCEDGSTFFAIKNDELPGFDQNAALWGFNLDYSIICVWNFTQKKGHAAILHGACTK